jgi:hypothetical protein
MCPAFTASRPATLPSLRDHLDRIFLPGRRIQEAMTSAGRR